MENLPETDLHVLSRGCCPVCFHRGFVIGPQGAKATNVECANLACRARFNVVWFSGKAMMGHAIPSDSPWPSEPEQ